MSKAGSGNGDSGIENGYSRLLVAGCGVTSVSSEIGVSVRIGGVAGEEMVLVLYNWMPYLAATSSPSPKMPPSIRTCLRCLCINGIPSSVH